MATITTRIGKGDPLTFTEMDSNLTNLNTDKLENINNESIGDLSDVDITTVAPTNGQALKWDSANSKFVAGDAGASSIDDLNDVDRTGVTDKDILMWDSINSKFVASSQYSSSSGGISGNVTAVDTVRNPNTITLDTYAGITAGDQITFTGSDVTSAGLSVGTTYYIWADVGTGQFEISANNTTVLTLTNPGTITDFQYSTTSAGESGFLLDYLSNVNITTPTQGSLLTYDTNNSEWNAQILSSLDSVELTDYTETVYVLGTVNGVEGTDFTINTSNGNVQRMTVNGNITINGPSGMTSGSSVTLIVTQDATGSRTLSSTMLFAGGDGTLSTDPNAVDIIGIFYDGTNYYASLSTGFATPV